MLSFPSSYSKGGSSLYQVGKSNTSKTKVPSPNESPLINVQSKNLKLTELLKKHIYSNDNQYTTFDGYVESKYLVKSTTNNKNLIYYEDPLKFDIRVLRGNNNYQFIFKNPVYNILDAFKEGNEAGGTVLTAATAVSPSLFNPLMTVNSIGISENVPLLNTVRSAKAEPILEPTIENLIRGSKQENGMLGNARYKLIDFLYCKDLGKVSNNHLITLRKFATPIGDHIYKWSTKRGDGPLSMTTVHDIGRLITWFDTDDNKLEDICKYEMQMSWKEIKNEIQEIESKEDSESRGPLGMIINSVSPGYNKWQSGAFGGPGNNVFSALATKIAPFKWGNEKSNDNLDALRMSSDQHKVWEPQNTVRDTHLYDGQLTLNQDITLTFSYKLRAYDNINPKSAFLDLIGNILEVTYQRGTYWKGKTRMIGPPQNKAAWKQADNIINHAWDKAGGFLASLASGGESFSNILGNLSQALSQAWNNIKNFDLGGVAESVKMFSKNAQIKEGLKGLLKNKLGRPALYAMNSLIDGQPCGFWHLTIGNPFNPIMCIGNLMMMSSSVQHTGPLGIDDFPTEIKVTVNLKPGRSRDATEISKYYTKGLSAIYLPKNRKTPSTYHNFQGKDDSFFNNLDRQSDELAMANDKKMYSTIKEQIIDDKDKDGNIIGQHTEVIDTGNLSGMDDSWTQIEIPNIDPVNGLFANNMYYDEHEEGIIAIAGTNNPEHYLRATDEHA